MFFWVFPQRQIVYFTLYNQPLKMGPIEGSETSANHYLTLGKYPEEHTQYSEHGESLKSRIVSHILYIYLMYYQSHP
jgi:hypothetical protein